MAEYQYQAVNGKSGRVLEDASCYFLAMTMRWDEFYVNQNEISFSVLRCFWCVVFRGRDREIPRHQVSTAQDQVFGRQGRTMSGEIDDDG